jgi:hypothetical protein
MIKAREGAFGARGGNVSTQQNDISTSARNDVAEIGVRLLDEAHTAWLAAERDCDQALGAWSEASPRDRGARYVSYRAALDREEAAARDLRRLWELAGPCLARL